MKEKSINKIRQHRWDIRIGKLG